MGGIDLSEPADVTSRARVVVGLVESIVPPSDFQDLRDQLPESGNDEN